MTARFIAGLPYVAAATLREGSDPDWTLAPEDNSAAFAFPAPTEWINRDK